MATEAQLEAVRKGANQDALNAISEAEASELVYSEEVEEEENTSNVPGETTKKLLYPLNIGNNFPARIVFKVIKVDGINLFEKTGIKKLVETVSEGIDQAKDFLSGTTQSTADEKITKEEKKKLIADSNIKPSELVSYENNTGGEIIASVTLPLRKALQYNDGASYKGGDLGKIGSLAEDALLGNNPFAGMSNADGSLGQAGSAMAAKLLVKNAGAIIGGAAGAFGGAVGAAAGGLIGAAADQLLGDGVETALSSTTRIASAPNERTLFERVYIRKHTFAFTLVANSPQEGVAIRNIIKLFREELYPEKIPVGASGVPLAYKFPNMFEIEIINRFQKTLGFKYQRCYLEKVSVTFNEQTPGLFDDGQFIEATLSLDFTEIVALDKQKIKLGY